MKLWIRRTWSKKKVKQAQVLEEQESEMAKSDDSIETRQMEVEVKKGGDDEDEISSQEDNEGDTKKLDQYFEAVKKSVMKGKIKSSKKTAKKRRKEQKLEKKQK